MHRFGLLRRGLSLLSLSRSEFLLAGLASATPTAQPIKTIGTGVSSTTIVWGLSGTEPGLTQI